MITSLDNPKIKLLMKLKMPKYRKKMGMFLVFGNHLVIEAKNKNLLIEAYSIYEKEGYIQISESIMKKIIDNDTLISEIALCKLEEKNELTNKILILDGIQDPGNLGTLLRTAHAFNFNTIVLGEGTVDLYNDKVIRASQGAIFKLNFRRENLINFIPSLNNYHIYGTDVVNGISLDDIKKDDNIAIVLGNEGNGISPDVKKILNKNIYIEMEDTESLNVAIAGALIMYKLR